MRQYDSLIRASILEERDCLELTRLLHNYYRNNSKLSPQSKERLYGYVEGIVNDLKARRLPGHPFASVHLLSYYRESGHYDAGLKLWAWLARQDASYTDARTHGAAIELLAYYGEALENLEEMFTQALRLFPGDFVEYHLSRHAILPDRSKAIVFGGARMVLLQGILTARLLRGDWRNAYLAFDTALRLYPNQVPRKFFELFIAERPLKEAYKVFLLACRSGEAPKAQIFNILLQKLLKSEGTAELSWSNARTIVLATLHAFQAFVSVDGNIKNTHLNHLIKGILLVARPPSTNESEQTDGNDSIAIKQKFSAAIVDLMNMFEKRGEAYSTATFNTIMSVAGRLRSVELIDLALQKMSEAGLSPDLITYRILINAAGELKDMQRVKSYWEALVKIPSVSRPTPELHVIRIIRDWKALTRAAKNCDDLAYVDGQLSKHKDGMSTHTIQTIQQEMSEGPKKRYRTSTERNFNDLDGFATEVTAKVSEIQQAVAAATNPSTTFREDRASMDMSYPLTPVSSLPEEISVALYDRLTSDPRRTTTASSSTPHQDEDPSPPGTTPVEATAAKPNTSYPWAKMRYENWKTINELLADAERNDAARRKRIDHAIDSGQPVTTGQQELEFFLAEPGGKGGRVAKASRRRAHTHDADADTDADADEEEVSRSSRHVSHILALRGYEQHIIQEGQKEPLIRSWRR
ncbi:MAG: hypothetical protein M1837_006079 [Sclerophora amabilis]|nr:MAG: hypothetical protein M1837_006079 [Sclerophora amabilis]